MGDLSRGGDRDTDDGGQGESKETVAGLAGRCSMVECSGEGGPLNRPPIPDPCETLETSQHGAGGRCYQPVLPAQPGIFWMHPCDARHRTDTPRWWPWHVAEPQPGATCASCMGACRQRGGSDTAIPLTPMCLLRCNFQEGPSVTMVPPPSPSPQ